MTLTIASSLVCLLNYFKHGSRSATVLTSPLYPSASPHSILALALQSGAAIPASLLLFLLSIISSGVIQALCVLVVSMAWRWVRWTDSCYTHCPLLSVSFEHIYPGPLPQDCCVCSHLSMSLSWHLPWQPLEGSCYPCSGRQCMQPFFQLLM